MRDAAKMEAGPKANPGAAPKRKRVSALMDDLREKALSGCLVPDSVPEDSLATHVRKLWKAHCAACGVYDTNSTRNWRILLADVKHAREGLRPIEVSPPRTTPPSSPEMQPDSPTGSPRSSSPTATPVAASPPQSPQKPTSGRAALSRTQRPKGCPISSLILPFDAPHPLVAEKLRQSSSQPHTNGPGTVQ